MKSFPLTVFPSSQTIWFTHHAHTQSVVFRDNRIPFKHTQFSFATDANLFGWFGAFDRRFYYFYLFFIIWLKHHKWKKIVAVRFDTVSLTTPQLLSIHFIIHSLRICRCDLCRYSAFGSGWHSSISCSFCQKKIIPKLLMCREFSKKKHCRFSTANHHKVVRNIYLISTRAAGTLTSWEKKPKKEEK